MAWSGINVVCRQCIHTCKQFEQPTVSCMKFKSNQSGRAKDTNPSRSIVEKSMNRKRATSRK